MTFIVCRMPPGKVMELDCRIKSDNDKRGKPPCLQNLDPGSRAGMTRGGRRLSYAFALVE